MKSWESVVLVAVAISLQLAAAHIDLPPELEKMIHETKDVCMAETGVSEDVVKAAEKMDIQPDPKLKCFLKCMMIKMHCLSDEGIFDHDMVMNSIPEQFKSQAIEDVVNKCKDMKGADVCDTAFEIAVCFAKNAEVLAELFS